MATETPASAVSEERLRKAVEYIEEDEGATSRYRGWLAQLATALPFATLQRDDAKLAPFTTAIADYVEGRRPSLDLPLDVRGSNFRRRVGSWLARPAWVYSAMCAVIR